MRTIVVFIIYTILAVLIIPILLLCAIFQWRDQLLNIAKGAIKISPAILGIRIDISGLEWIQEDASYVYMANHLSFIDGPLLFMIIPQPVRVILKKEIFRIPIIGQAMRFVQFVPVDRKGFSGGKISIDRASFLMKSRKYSFLIFPEGTRSRDGHSQHFKRGGFFLALKAGAAIVPVTIKGSFEIMPRGTFFTKKGKVRVEFHPPVPVSGHSIEDLPVIMDRVRNTIRLGIGEPTGKPTSLEVQRESDS